MIPGLRLGSCRSPSQCAFEFRLFQQTPWFSWTLMSLQLIYIGNSMESHFLTGASIPFDDCLNLLENFSRKEPVLGDYIFKWNPSSCCREVGITQSIIPLSWTLSRNLFSRSFRHAVFGNWWVLWTAWDKTAPPRSCPVQVQESMNFHWISMTA